MAFILLKQSSASATIPQPDRLNYFVDIVDNKLKVKDETGAVSELVVTTIYSANTLQIFKKAGNVANTLEAGDWCIGVLQGDRFQGQYVSGDPSLLASFDIENQYTLS